MSTRLGGHAAVIGASMAGMMTARVLSDYFDQVTILDRDELGETPANRKSVPQGKHVHALLLAGERLLSSLYPGFTDDLDAAGAIRVRLAAESAFHLPDGVAYNPWGTLREPVDLGLDMYSQSRPLLEHCVRRRTRQMDNIAFECGVAVTSLVSSDGRVCGLEYGSNGAASAMEADLVVDACGRGSRAVRWLDELGFAAPPESEIGVDHAYSSARFRIPVEVGGDAKLKIFFGPPPDYKDGGIMGRIEGDEWIVSLAGRLGNYPPKDHDGFLAFAEGIYDSTMFDMIAAGERVSDIVHYRFPTSLWRHYEALETFPERFLVLGDAIASFNPQYGQGMSAAANQVGALQALLAQRAEESGGLDGLSGPFFAAAAEIVETPWALAAGQDLVYPETVGERPDDMEERGRYFGGLAALCGEDPEVNRRVVEVFQLLRPISILMEDPLKSRVEAKISEMEG